MAIQIEFMNDKVVDGTEHLIKRRGTDPTQRINEGEILLMYLSQPWTMFYIELADQYLDRLRKQ
jgi:hypothetical protein